MSQQQSVIAVLSKEPLTTIEILEKAHKVPHILKLYTILDELRSKGVINSYVEEGIKFHCVA